MLTVRLTPEMEAAIDRLAYIHKKTKSEVVKEALMEYIQARGESGSAYELGKDLFGIAGSEDGNRSSTYRKRLKEKLGEKHAH